MTKSQERVRLTTGGRKRLRVQDGFGKAVYEGMVRQRADDGLAWYLPDLAEATGVHVNTVRSWITKGTLPDPATLGKLARAIQTTTDALLLAQERQIYPIYPPAEPLKVAESIVPAISAETALDADERANASRSQEGQGSPPQQQTR